MVLLILMRATGADYPAIIGTLAVVCFLLFGFLAVTLNRALAPPGPVMNLPLAFLGFNYGVLCYFSSGVEAPLVQVSALLYGLYVLCPQSRILQVTLGLTPLVRHELALALLLSAAWGWQRTRRPPLAMLSSAALALGAWGGFRIVYYAELLPNTFYLKDTVSVAQGLAYVHDTLGPYHFYGLAAAAIVLILWLRRGGGLHLAERGMMLLLALSVTLYVVRIGGDPRHFRYLAFPFCLAVASFAGLAEAGWARGLPRAPHWLLPVVGLLVAGLSFSFYPRQLTLHPGLHPRETRHRQVDLINDAMGHRRSPNLRFETWSQDANADEMRSWRQANSPFVYRGVKVTGMCVEAYSAFDHRVVHLGGLTDAILARTKMQAQRPAHKLGLRALAGDLARIQRRVRSPGRGMYRELVAQQRAPAWIARNLDTVEIIERKIYNDHRLWENLRLSLSFPDRIDPQRGAADARP